MRGALRTSTSITGGAFRSSFSAFGVRERKLAANLQKRASEDPLLKKIQSKSPINVTVTGAAGAIGYALLFRIANGELLGPDVPVRVTGLELPFAMKALQGVGMELQDCAFPLVSEFVQTDNADAAFAGCDIALLVGSKPRGPGMERADLIKDNGAIFQNIGRSLNNNAEKHCRVTVVGNPCNTNALICANNAPNIPLENFTAMTRLDHDRAIAMLGTKTGMPVNEVDRFCIWGNHSATMFPDLSHTTIHGTPAAELLGFFRSDRYWLNEFTPKIQKRGAQIISARGSSSAASAANACIAHTRDWCLGSEKNDWTSMAYASEGQYGVPEGLMFSFPTFCRDGVYQTAEYPDTMEDVVAYGIEQNIKELLEERDVVSHLL